MAKGSVSHAQMTFTEGNTNGISGIVTNSATGTPIAGATVSCTVTGGCNNQVSATTDSQGRYSLGQINFQGNSATVVLSASATGFGTGTRSVAVSNDASIVTGQNFTLTP